MKRIIFLFCTVSFSALGQSSTPFVSSSLIEQGDLSEIMIEDVDRFLMKKTDEIYQNIGKKWSRDFTSEDSFDESISSQRELLKRRLGLVEQRIAPGMDILNNSRLKPFEIETNYCTILAVRWSVLDGLSAEGLLLQPKGKVVAQIVLIPDADIIPEVFAGLQNSDDRGFGLAVRLAEAGWEVLIPVLVNRSDAFSGNPALNKYTNQPHREWIYRQAYEVGRHVIGYELQKIFSAVDWFEAKNTERGYVDLQIGIAGYGEGGLLALYASSIDTRFASTLVSGYFDSRKRMWEEPIYRNVFGLLNTFGDAELGAMLWPRTLVVEHSKGPEISGPPQPSEGRGGAAPGSLNTPDYFTAKAEWDRVKSIIPSGSSNLHWYANGTSALDKPFSMEAFNAFTKGLGVKVANNFSVPSELLVDSDWIDVVSRQKRIVREIEHHVQRVLDLCEMTRNKDFWSPLFKENLEVQSSIKAGLREKFGQQIGRLPTPIIPANPRSRLIEKTEMWTSYDVQLDVWPGVFAWGILIIPNDIEEGDERPVVVCQHGLEGVPADVVTTDPNDAGYHYYKGFAAQLAERGYVTFAPFNLYRGGDKFRVLQRKGNPLGLTLFSVIAGQHERILEWLKQQSFVDSERIGFYGLSYGGKTAMRVPALVEGYALSICSADFNEWVRKCATTDYPFSYMFTGEYDMPEWDLGHTFNYAEMAGLIAPRPFMVERGHFDRVGTDEWVGFEFEKVRRHYDLLGLSDSVCIEYFTGPHSINGKGTFEFLDRHLMKASDESLRK